jgi:hypothetical protein
VRFLLAVLLTTCLWAEVPRKYEPTIAPSGYSNPRTFNFGMLAAEPFTIHPTPQKIWTVIQLRPYSTPLLYSETILLCGDITEQLEDAGKNYIVLVYSRASSEMVRDPHLPFITDTCRAFDGMFVVPVETDFTKENK